MDAIEKYINIQIKPHHLQLYPTAIELASYILSQTTQSYPPKEYTEEKFSSSMVCLQEGDKDKFLFLIHPVGGTFFVYRDLIHGWSSKLTVYGIQSPNIKNRTFVTDSIEDLAKNYIDMIKNLNPQGKCILGGFSFGGMVAYEMAQQLSLENFNIDTIIMLDTPHHSSLPKKFNDYADIISYLLLLGSNYYINADDLRLFSIEDQIKLFLKHSDKIKQEVLHISTDIIIDFLNIFKSNIILMSRYIPKPYLGISRILFFRAMEKDPINPENPALGWDNLLKNQLKIYDIPGNHISMMFKPNIIKLCNILNTLL